MLELSVSISGNRLSGVAGHNNISVEFYANEPYQEFQCRATKADEPWGLGIGYLVAAFSYTPEATMRQFDIYDEFLIRGDGEYRITLFAKGMDGKWNIQYTILPLFQFPFESTSDDSLDMGDILME